MASHFLNNVTMIYRLRYTYMLYIKKIGKFLEELVCIIVEGNCFGYMFIKYLFNLRNFLKSFNSVQYQKYMVSSSKSCAYCELALQYLVSLWNTKVVFWNVGIDASCVLCQQHLEHKGTSLFQLQLLSGGLVGAGAGTSSLSFF